MEFSENHNRPCLSDTDYSAIALYMKCLGDQLDEEFTEVQDSFNEFLNRPAAAWIATSTQTNMTGDNFGFFLQPGAVTWSVNWPALAMAPGIGPRLNLLRGWYYVGANVTVSTMGAATLNSVRRLEMIIDAGITPGTPPDLGTFNDQVYDSGVATDSLQVAGTVFYPGPVEPTISPYVAPGITCNFYNTNVASDMQTTLTPPFTVWVVYLGDTAQIQGA